jgi:hypothetical protein
MEIEHPYITPVMDTVEGSSVVFLFHIIDTYGTRTDYLYGSSYLRILNIFGAEKGDNFSVVLAKEFLDGEDTSLTSTILGEPYANLGMASIFIVILETLAFYLISKFSRNNIQIKTIFFVIAILCMRYYFSVVFIIIFFTLLLYYMFKKLSKISIIN